MLDTDRVVTIHLGPPPTPPASVELDQPQLAEGFVGRSFVVAIGTEERRKALPVLVQAFGLFAADDSDTRLVLAGAPGDDSDQIGAAIEALPTPTRERIHRLGRSTTIRNTGWCATRRPWPIPASTKDSGFRSSSRSRREPRSWPARAGAIPEVAGEAAVLVDEHQPEAFANGLHRVLGSGVERLGLIESGYRNVGRFSWDATADGLIELYRRAQEDR